MPLEIIRAGDEPRAVRLQGAEIRVQRRNRAIIQPRGEHLNGKPIRRGAAIEKRT